MIDVKQQARAPFVEALEQYCALHMTAFHTPGHKLGAGAPSYEKQQFGPALARDLGVMYALDDLFEPEGPLREAMELAADLYGAGRTFFSVNGTTACIEAMILAVCKPGDAIILPREAHKSVLNGVVLSGAVPVYMEGGFAPKEDVALGPTVEAFHKAIAKRPDAKAVVFTYPTYDGVCCDLGALITAAHEKGLYVLVDEAHGAHLAFHEELPRHALSLGADCVAQSTHKLIGSLTQTSMLHCRKGFPCVDAVAKAMHLVQSTSPHYWFLASLDAARQQMALEGHKREEQTLGLARMVRSEIQRIPGLSCFSKSDISRYDGVADFDETKLTIAFDGLGLTGAEAERLLRKEGIEVELTAGNHVLALMTIGDSRETAQALLHACRKVAKTHALVAPKKVPALPLPAPTVVVTPRQAWFGQYEDIPFAEAQGRISAETVTFYPPGIPVVAVGEELTAPVLAYMTEKRGQGYEANGAHDNTLRTLRVLV